MKNMKNVFGLALVASCGLAMPVLAQVTETEPNETRANADAVGVIDLPSVDGPALTGTTTGTSLTTPGAASADTFRVRTATMAQGIWRNRLVITTGGTAGHTGTIRGLAQTTVGTINPASDNAAQTSATGTVPARFNQWYTFGPQAELYYRVTGGATTTAPYVVNYEVASVSVIPVAGTITAGNVTITETGAIDADYWVYDSNFNPIAGFGIDTSETTGVTRSMTPGTYYLAMARFNGANNLASAAPETFAGTVLDFPGAWVGGGSTNTTSTATPVFNSSSGTVTATTSNLANYEVAWYQFTVSAPTNPIVNSVIATPGSGPVGTATTVVATVTPAPDLAPITSVSLDATSINAGTVGLADNGVAPDVTAGDNQWTGTVTVGVGTTLGSKTLTATATDASARTANNSGTFSVTPPNDSCATATPLNNAGPFPYNVGPINMTGYTVDGDWTGCFTSTPSGPDQWFTFTAPTDGILTLSTCIADTGGATTRDTMLGIATSCGTTFTVCEDDESGACGLGSKIDLAVTSGTTYWVSYRQWGTTLITDGLMQVNFIPGTPLSISNINTTDSTIYTNGAPSSTVVTAQITPGTLPPSTGITVSINAAAAGLGTISMLDDGNAPDATANDGIYSATMSAAGATLGAYTFTVSAADQETRTANGTFAQAIDQLDETGETVATANLALDATSFNGRLNTTTDVDMYKIYICDPATFSATTVGGITPPGTTTGSDTSLFLFRPDGTGVSFSDDISTSNYNTAMDNTQIASQPAGEYYLAIAYFANDAFDTSALEMWLDTPFAGTRAPDGAGAAGTLGDWVGTGTITNYTLSMTGVSLTSCGPVCDSIDFNNDTSLFDPQDIDAFLSVYSEGPCIPEEATCNDIDFNNDTSVFDPCDISSFLLQFSEGPCELCPV